MNAPAFMSASGVSTDRGDLDRRRDRRIVAVAFGVAVAYASVRYNVIKGVPWSEWPIYTLNKAIAVGSLALLVAAVWSMVRRRSPATLMAWAGAGVMVHVAASLAILNPAYFTHFYEDGKLTFVAALSLMIGCAAATGMEVGARKSGRLTLSQQAWAIATIAGASGVHAGMTGLSSWLRPGSWPGGLPPITLISALLGCAAVAIVGAVTFQRRVRVQQDATSNDRSSQL